jgi:site-specific DNA-methyltransferase (adenine-specific)
MIIAKRVDCLVGLGEQDTGSVSVVVTSPPYNIGVKYSKYNDNRVDYWEWLFNVFVEIKRVLIEDGHFFLQMGGIAKLPLIPYQALTQALRAEFVLQNQIVWVKNISIGQTSHGQFKPINSKRFVNHTYEFIFHLTKTGKVSIERLSVGVPFTYESNIGRFNHTSNLRCRGSVWFIPYDTIQNKEERYNHPATFPVALPEMCIRLAGVPQGSLILDPFVGVGSTLIACKRLGMRGLGFDIDPDYVRDSNKRVAEIDI